MAPQNEPTSVTELVLDTIRHYATTNGGLALDVPISCASRLTDDLGFDVLDIVECLNEIEDAIFQQSNIVFCFPEASCDEIQTVGDIVHMVKTYFQSGAPYQA